MWQHSARPSMRYFIFCKIKFQRKFSHKELEGCNDANMLLYQYATQIVNNLYFSPSDRFLHLFERKYAKRDYTARLQAWKINLFFTFYSNIVECEELVLKLNIKLFKLIKE